MNNGFFGVGFVIGIVLGSLVKVLVDRSLINRSFLGRSYCPHCKQTLQWYDLLPIVSYVILRGKCRYCHEKIGVEYLLVEVVLGTLVGFLFFQTTGGIQGALEGEGYRLQFQTILFILDLIFKIFFICVLSVLFITDIKKMFIPDRVVIPAIWLSLLYLLGITILKITYLYYSLSQTSLGKLLLPPHNDYFQRHAQIAAEPLFGSIAMALMIGGFFLVLIIITKGKGMGGGDVKLGAFMSLGLGFPLSLLALMSAFLSGAIVSVALIVLGKKHFGQTIPFGPFLVLGSLIALFWGNKIVNWYLHLAI